MIVLKSVRIEDFKLLRRVDLAFPRQGSVLIEGLNESGKSTLFESVFYALYGTPLIMEGKGRGSLESVIRYGSESMLVELRLEVDQTELTVRRTLKRGKASQASLVIRMPGGLEERVSGVTAVNQRIVEELGGLDGDALLNSCFVEQKKVSKLEDLGAAQRRESLRKLLNLDRLTALADRFRVAAPEERALDEARKRLDLAEVCSRLPALHAERKALEACLGGAVWAPGDEETRGAPPRRPGTEPPRPGTEPPRHQDTRGTIEPRGHEDTKEPDGLPLPGGEGQGEGYHDVVGATEGPGHPGDVDPRLRGDDGDWGVTAPGEGPTTHRAPRTTHSPEGPQSSALGPQSSPAQHAPRTAHYQAGDEAPWEHLAKQLEAHGSAAAAARRRGRLLAAASAAGLLVIAALMVAGVDLGWVLLISIGLVGVLAVLAALALQSAGGPEREAAHLRTQLARRRDSLLAEIGDLEGRKSRAEAALGVDGASLDVDECRREVERMAREIEVKRRAASIVEGTMERIVRLVLPNTERNLGQILPLLTAGRYHEARIGADYQIQVWDDSAGRYVSKNVFSGGARDQFSLALRLAFALATLPEELGTTPGFIFLDEPLSSFDGPRTEALVRLLTTGQVAASFSQIFVISHSRSFDPGAFQYRLEMRDGRVVESNLPG